MSLTKVFTSVTSGFKQDAVTQELTAEGLKQIFEEVRSDPEAGLGCLSMEAIVIDKIMRRWNVCIAKYRNLPVRQPRPIIAEPVPAMPSETTQLALNAAKAAKAAGM